MQVRVFNVVPSGPLMGSGVVDPGDGLWEFGKASLATKGPFLVINAQKTRRTTLNLRLPSHSLSWSNSDQTSRLGVYCGINHGKS